MVSVLGAECTGKSQLCAGLGASMAALIVPEYLRTWCDIHRRTPQQHEQIEILQGQIEAERMAFKLAEEQGIEWILVDAGPLMTAIYSLEYFDDDSLCAAALAHQSGYALTLVMDDAIQWIAGDWQRDSPQRRASCQRRLRTLLDSAGVEFHTIVGAAEQRLQQVRGLLSNLS